MRVIPLHTNEARLIEKAAKNNKEAQQYIFNVYAPKMLSVCRYYITDLQFAEDVMITAFFKVFSNLKSFRHKGSFEGWIRKIVIREAISFLRSKKQFVYIEDNFKAFSDNVKPENESMAHLEVDEIQLLIDDLPEGYKTIFLLFAEGYTHKEIAALLDISENTSKSQLHKARKILKEKVKQLDKRENGTQ